MYAVVETGSKQYRVSPGDRVRVEKLEGKSGDSVLLDRVLLVSGEGKILVGSPTVAGASVRAEILRQARDRKVTVFKYKPKKHYRVKRGHRQAFTLLKIDSITAP